MPPETTPTRKAYIKSYGCQMNVYDATRMHDVLQGMGYAATESAEDADLVILNTCHIREKAEEKVYSDLGRVRAEKERLAATGREMKIAVAGCVAQAAGEEIFRRAPFVDLVFGPQSYHELPKLLKDSGNTRHAFALDFPEFPKFDFLPEASAPAGSSAFLAVQEGCDKFCTFCVVPYTRGAEYSRTPVSILTEAKKLVDGGAVELTLLGQNVNAYHGEDEHGRSWSLAELISKLADLSGLERIRYTTSHPRDMLDDLIDLHGTAPKLMPYLHLPIQSGSDVVLKRMNRKHDAAFYLNIIEKLRRSRPDMAFSGDFIVGFPGETERDFEDTLAIVAAVGYASAYSFKYSPRPGTPAAEKSDQVAEDVKDERLQRLQAALRDAQTTFNQATVGRTLPVLLERDGKRSGQLIGKSPYMQSVHIEDAAHLRGRIVEARITAAYANSLAGELAAPISLHTPSTDKACA